MSRLEKKLKITAERLYRSGLARARAGDLGRAATDLQSAVHYWSHHTQAWNLLGLVQFRRGELGEAIKAWSISRHLNPENEQARNYLITLRREREVALKMDEALRLYNEALTQVKSGDIDFAMARLKKAVRLSPTLVNAHMLLALCYIKQQHYKTAQRVLDQLAKVDPLNSDAMRYRLYIAEQRRSGSEDASRYDIPDLSRDLYVQQALPEPDLEELSYNRSGRKKRYRGVVESLKQVLLFFAGVICCLGFMLLLWKPQQVQELTVQLQQREVDISRLRHSQELITQRAETARSILQQIEDDGSASVSTMADIKQLLETWEQEAINEEANEN